MKACKIFLIILELPIALSAQDNAVSSSDLSELPLEQLVNLQVTTAPGTAGKSNAVPVDTEIIKPEQFKVRDIINTGFKYRGVFTKNLQDTHEPVKNYLMED
jgi:hypothetical protein